MNESQSLERFLETLRAVKAAIRDTAEPGIIEQLNQSIDEIQELLESGDSSEAARAKAWECLGLFFKSLPSIAELIELLSSG